MYRTSASSLRDLKMVASEDIGRQVLTYGVRKPIEHFLKAVDKVSLDDIALIARKLLASSLTMESHGDVINIPTYDSVSIENKERVGCSMKRFRRYYESFSSEK